MLLPVTRLRTSELTLGCRGFTHTHWPLQDAAAPQSSVAMPGVLTDVIKKKKVWSGCFVTVKIFA